MSPQVLSVCLAFWILNELKFDFHFPVHINVLLKIQILALKKEKKRNQNTHLFYIRCLAKFLHMLKYWVNMHAWTCYIVNNCCHVFQDDRLVATLGIEGFIVTRNIKYFHVLFSYL